MSSALQVFRHLFASVTDEMGIALRDSAVSPNIKERLDYSCALLDARGRLVAHAAHIPVHLGSAHLTVPRMLEEIDPGPGDVVVLNDPHRGGTHLNDVTVVAPLYAGDKRVGFLLDRAHHADIGGAEPGSMSGALDLYGEGLRLPPVLLLRAGQPVDEVWRIFAANVRDPEAARGDLLAQCAALHRGAHRFDELVQRFGGTALSEAMEELHAHGARMSAALLGDWPKRAESAADTLDGDGTPRIELRLQVRRGRLQVDFRGSSPQVPGSWNTHQAVATSAVFFVLQALAPDELPETSGTLDPVDLLLPEASVIASTTPAGVALGNVETSQRIVDVLLAALRKLLPGQVPAASQGTMNNLLFGGTRADGRPFVYYETLGGGGGAGPDGPGASAVQSMMTNTRNTPVEVMEAELPVRVLELALRRGSGGKGAHRGGEGLLKRVQFLVPARVTVAATRRRTRPAGAQGGGPGQSATDRIRRVDGRSEPAVGTRALEPGDVVEVRSPGGGGYGSTII